MIRPVVSSKRRGEINEKGILSNRSFRALQGVVIAEQLETNLALNSAVSYSDGVHGGQHVHGGQF